MSFVGWFYGWVPPLDASSVKYGSVTVQDALQDSETNQAQQAASIATLNANAVVAYRVSAIGTGAGVLINVGQTVRIPLPAITESFPNDGRWNRLGTGVIEYDGTLGGVYECHCPVAFGTSLAALASYTFSVVEGTGLDTGSPVVRDTVSFSVERQLVGINVTAAITGLLTLQPTGGQLALRVTHSAGLAVTVTPATISLLNLRVSQAP